MPLYDYKCTQCDKVSEVMRRIIELETPIHCNDCGQALEKLVCAPNVAIPPQHRAVADKMRYYGIKNPVTGEGITKNTDVSVPSGVKAKKRG